MNRKMRKRKKSSVTSTSEATPLRPSDSNISAHPVNIMERFQSKDLDASDFSLAYTSFYHRLRETNLGLVYTPSLDVVSPQKIKKLPLEPLIKSNRSDFVTNLSDSAVTSVLFVGKKNLAISIIHQLENELIKCSISSKIQCSSDPSLSVVREANYIIFLVQLDDYGSLVDLEKKIVKLRPHNGSLSVVLGISSREGPVRNIVSFPNLYNILQKFQLKYYIWSILETVEWTSVLRGLVHDIKLCTFALPTSVNIQHGFYIMPK